MAKSITRTLNGTTLKSVLEELHATERSRRQVLFLGGILNSENEDQSVNTMESVFNAGAGSLPILEIDQVPTSNAAEVNFLKEKMKTHLSVSYSEVFIQGEGFVKVLLSRPGRIIKLEGKMSTFGGPNDSGVGPNEGLAIVNKFNFGIYEDYFLDRQIGGDKPLARNLNPTKNYIACRWDYEITPKNRLKDCRILVTNPLNGENRVAEAVDYGPHPTTGRVTDLSPGLAERLDLETDDLCEVEILVPPDLVNNAPGPAIKPAEDVKLLSQSEIISSFGDPRPYTNVGGGRIRPRGGFESENMTLANIPAVKVAANAPESGKVYCHKKVVPYLESAFEEIGNDPELAKLILTWDGMFVARHMGWDNSRSLSRHTWAIAFDINKDFNGWGDPPAPEGERGSVLKLVPIFEKHGFYWGGHFRPKQDGMHFEFGRII